MKRTDCATGPTVDFEVYWAVADVSHQFSVPSSLTGVGSGRLRNIISIEIIDFVEILGR